MPSNYKIIVRNKKKSVHRESGFISILLILYGICGIYMRL